MELCWWMHQETTGSESIAETLGELVSLGHVTSRRWEVFF